MGRLMVIVLAIVVLVTAGICADSVSRIAYTERFETGRVQIRMQDLSDDNEVEFIQPNERIEYLPHITNEGASCYVRVHIEIGTDSDDADSVGLDRIYGMDKKWIRQGEYFYYTEPLNSGQRVRVLSGIQLAENWNAGSAGKLHINLNAEAVQSRNFSPDFDEILPWGAVMLSEVGEGTRQTDALAKEKTSLVDFTEAGTFECTTSYLFDAFKEMMPGDKYEKNVELRNSSESELNTSLNITALANTLNEKLKLKIYCDGNEIFEGTASEAGDIKNFALDKIPRGQSSKLKIAVEFPAEAGNQYIEIADNIVWELTAAVDKTDSSSRDGVPVRTADMTNLMPWILVVIGSVLCMLLLVCWRKGKHEQSD